MDPRIVSQTEWLSARKQHLLKENEFTRRRDELSTQRRELRWEKVEKQYVFDEPRGKETLPIFGTLPQGFSTSLTHPNLREKPCRGAWGQLGGKHPYPISGHQQAPLLTPSSPS